MNKALLFLLLITSITQSANAAFIRSKGNEDVILIVGSVSTAPIIGIAAEEFGLSTKFFTPMVDSVGTGAGFRSFCARENKDRTSADIIVATRQMRYTEKNSCSSNGIGDVIEIELGHDCVVLVTAKDSELHEMTRVEIFEAIAEDIGQDSRVVPNSNMNWSDISYHFPVANIKLYGPRENSGTRDVISNLIMQSVCMRKSEFQHLYPDTPDRAIACSSVRKDGYFVESSDNEVLIINKVSSDPGSVGIMSYFSLSQNRDKVKPLSIDGVEPTLDSIINGSYILSRPVYLYVKRNHIGEVNGLKQFLLELMSNDAVGPSGYLTRNGLIAPNQERRLEYVQMIEGDDM